MSIVLAENSKWMSVQEVAAYLNISGGRVRQLLISGQLRGEKLGPVWAVSRAEVERFDRLDRVPGNPKFRKPS